MATIMDCGTDNKYLIGLGALTRSEAPVAGHKAANLGELARAGFPVPDGSVLTVDAFERFLVVNSLGRDSDAKAAAAASIPADIEAELRVAAQSFGDTALAVRSSGIAEDLAGASFAGQYETVLGVRGAEDLLAAVQHCWTSAFSQRVTAYRAAQAAEATGRVASMAVLIQHLVPAEAAGVAFTANPVTGDRAETVVSAVRGLGERLVSGAASPDEWVLRGRKAERRSGPEGAIDSAQVQAIAGLARRVEEHFGAPQDIEWAMAGGNLYLLQARPITALPDEVAEPVPVPVEPPPGFWQREESHAPKPHSPMNRSLLFPARNVAVRDAFDAHGVPLLETMEFREIGGWEYMRLVPLGGKDRPAPPPG